MAQSLGIVDIIWKGKQLPVEAKTGKFKLGGLMNTPVVLNRRVDRSQHFEHSEVTATIPLERGVSLVDLFNPDPGELQVKCDTGQTYILPDAVIGNRPGATAGEGGKVEIMWFGDEAEELVA